MSALTAIWGLGALCAVYLGLTESDRSGRALALLLALVFVIGAWASSQ